ncbi:hypothetical protein MO973_28985 [Paenibacillus sp. TRM 82003]|uniref:hypothetical protein n=1 Tax=Kineococcus sp. TRM81007 TaxID=2925831 RepID=UPI001F577B94|nr:hypothetical protein [Kineococcus sp. TRM81007]MCI2238859.1 hypothetical protein [Kineococcus sp. TRM81007]MCI3924264.1 hypothetical protein [Paenibacillus sp. TRM 82003]
MGAVDVQADGEHRYAATLTTAGGTSSSHVVTCDAGVLEELGATAADEPVLVRRVLEVLVRSADEAEAAGRTPAVPEVVDLRELDRQVPDLLPNLPLR